MSEANASTEVPGLRARKRRETEARIVAAGMRLFGRHGYDGTTLDAIAAEAGISRRTFFHYFKSKDDILISLHSGVGERVIAALEGKGPSQRPIAAVRDALVGTLAPYPLEEMIALDRLMRSSEAVQKRKLASYAEDEAVLFEGLRRHWPQSADSELRIVAAVSIALLRLSLDRWSREGGARPLASVLAEGFATLEAAVTPP